MKTEYDITKPSGFNPGIQAKKTVPIRFVKVKTIGDLTFQAVQDIVWENTKNGWEPAWEEILEEDTPELDTVTIFEGGLHQSTVPIPLDIFPKCAGMSLNSIEEYTASMCEKQGWKASYKRRMMVLDHLNMD